MAKKIRVYDLARDLGLDNGKCLELCKSLGIGVKATSSSMDEAHAYRVRKLAENQNLLKPEPAPEPKPSPAARRPATPAPGLPGRRPATGPTAAPAAQRVTPASGAAASPATQRIPPPPDLSAVSGAAAAAASAAPPGAPAAPARPAPSTRRSETAAGVERRAPGEPPAAPRRALGEPAAGAERRLPGHPATAPPSRRPASPDPAAASGAATKSPPAPAAPSERRVVTSSGSAPPRQARPAPGTAPPPGPPPISHPGPTGAAPPPPPPHSPPAAPATAPPAGTPPAPSPAGPRAASPPPPSAAAAPSAPAVASPPAAPTAPPGAAQPPSPSPTASAAPATDAPGELGRKAPLSPAGKPIPPPPPPPRSMSGKPIPPPPMARPRRTDSGTPGGPRRPGAPAGRRGPPTGDRRPSGGPRQTTGTGRPAGFGAPRAPGAGAPRGPGGVPGRGPGGGPGRGTGRGGLGRQPQRRRKTRRRRRFAEELRPVDIPTYTPDDAPVPTGEIVIERLCSPQDLGPRLNRTAADVVRFMLENGEMVTATQSLSDEMIELFAANLGVEVQLVDPGQEQEAELQALLAIERDDDTGTPEERPPVVTVMGHVDHGKTSLLDQIRNADVVAGEAGGITQHIGAYQVQRNGHSITFIDTPGHEAFTAMRARGADATDIVVLVVAADDGVMPQTVEAINHAQAAEVPIVVALNKIDRPNADPLRVMQQLAEHDLVPEQWGGNTVTCEVSALQNTGIDDLLEQILVVAELEELQAYPTGRAEGVVLESHLDIGRGPVATLLVQDGNLRVGEPVVAGAAWGRVRALINDRGEQVDEATPGMPIRVLGLSAVAVAGAAFAVAPNDKVASRVAGTREHWQRIAGLGRDLAVLAGGARLEDIFQEIQAGETARLKIIVKADMNGSLEAIIDALRKVERDDVKMVFVHSAVGAVSENDIQLAATAGATIIGFNVRPDRKARALAEAEQVEIRTYEVIYQVIEDVQAALVGMLSPTFEEHVTGEAEVRAIFRIRGVGAIAGCYVTNGLISRGSKVRFLRDGAVIWNGEVRSLRRFKDDVAEVRSGFECGIGLSGFQDLKSGDVIETYEVREVQPT